MKDRQRKDASRMRAEAYAPRPQSSLLTYGIVGVLLAGLALIAFARFYDVILLAYSAWIAAGLPLAFAASIVLRMVRSRRHATAYREEYERARPG
jgi:hypothetical protein